MDGDIGPSRRTTGARSGGRSERVVEAVLRATLTELGRVGYAALRHDDIAQSAGVAKTTIYRRWPTKVELVEAAIGEFGRSYDDDLPDEGSVRADMLVLLESAMKRLSTPEGRAIARMVTMEGADPEIDAICRKLKERSRKHRASLVVRAQKRGLLPKDADPALIVDSVFSLVMSRLLRFGEKVDRPTCERLIDLVVTGAEHGGGKRR
ncbi:MAG: TetR/AcrR family transcriptional regulator [Polyangiaceae bacterium]